LPPVNVFPGTLRPPRGYIRFPASDPIMPRPGRADGGFYDSRHRGSAQKKKPLQSTTCEAVEFKAFKSVWETQWFPRVACGGPRAGAGDSAIHLTTGQRESRHRIHSGPGGFFWAGGGRTDPCQERNRLMAILAARSSIEAWGRQGTPRPPLPISKTPFSGRAPPPPPRIPWPLTRMPNTHGPTKSSGPIGTSNAGGFRGLENGGPADLKWAAESREKKKQVVGSGSTDGRTSKATGTGLLKKA